MYGCDTAEHAAKSSSERWCGQTDWRLPSAGELQSLLFDTGYAGAPQISTGFFPHTGRLPYWSADLLNDGQSVQAVLVDFADGEVYALPLDRVARVRLVSGRAQSFGAASRPISERP